MYTILLNSNKQLIATHREAIIQKSNLVDKIRFLVPTIIGDNEIGDFDSVHVEYLTPVSKTYYNEPLTLSEDVYNDTHYQYIVPVDTHLTDEAGDIQVQLSFYKVEMEEHGAVDGLVFKTTGCNIQIIPIENWQQFVPDKSLLGIDQKILKLIATEEGISARQDAIEAYQAEIVDAMQKGLIDDENISELTTYSSKKIEEKFIDEQEVNDEFVEREITNDAIDEMFDESVIDEEISNAEPINNSEIDEMFGEENSGNDSSDANTDDETNGNTNPEEITDISDEEIDNMFNGDSSVDDEL